MKTKTCQCGGIVTKYTYFAVINGKLYDEEHATTKEFCDSCNYYRKTDTHLCYNLSLEKFIEEDDL